jgi:hypothetical protein
MPKVNNNTAVAMKTGEVDCPSKKLVINPAAVIRAATTKMTEEAKEEASKKLVLNPAAIRDSPCLCQFKTVRVVPVDSGRRLSRNFIARRTGGLSRKQIRQIRERIELESGV